MSIAQAQKIRELELHVAEMTATLFNLAALVNKLTERVEAIENRPRPGRPPKDSP
jgi:uncharacterized coiled-coil protein SlyX